MKTFTKLLLFLKPFWKWVLLSILVSCATIFSSIGLLGTSAYLISRAALQPSIAVLQVSIVGVRFFGISRGIFRYLERLISHYVNFNLLTNLRIQFYRSLEPLVPAIFDKLHSADLLARSIDDIEQLEDFYVRAVAPFISAAIITLSMTFFMRSFDRNLALILFLGLSSNAVLIPILSWKSSNNAGKGLVDAQYISKIKLFDYVNGLADLQIYQAEESFKQEIYETLEKHESCQISLGRNIGIINSLNLLLSNLTLWLILLFAIPLISNGEIEGTLLAVITLLTLSSFEAVDPLGLAAQKLTSAIESARRLFEIEQKQPIEEKQLSNPNSDQKFSIQIQQLSYCYPTQTENALKDIDLNIHNTEKIAIVGPSGCGKTTLVKLMLAFRHEYMGDIYLSGIDYQSLSNTVIRNQISLVSQESHLFSQTIANNILLGKPEAKPNEIMEALHSVGLDNLINELPDGLETWVGENGKQISAGERQRLIIARTLLQDKPFLIFDEASANLDPVVAAEILENIFKFTKNKSLLWITHHFAHLDKFDKIYVMDKGRIIESGTYENLMKEDSFFKMMWQLQNQELIAGMGTFPPGKPS